MSEAVRKLIEETRANCESLKQEIEEYTNIIEELRNAFSKKRYIEHIGEEKEFRLAMSYYARAYDGRKVCFSIGGTKEEHKQMIEDLVTSGNMESFIQYLTNTAFPLYQSESRINNFYF